MNDLREMASSMTACERKAPLTLGQFAEFLAALDDRLAALETRADDGQVAAAPPKPRVRATVGSPR
jgi:hypothetical protein